MIGQADLVKYWFGKVNVLIITFILVVVFLSPITASHVIVSQQEYNITNVDNNHFLLDSIVSSDHQPLKRDARLQWKYETTEGSYISTPTIVNLTGDKNSEIAFISDADMVYLLSSSGNLIWKNNNYSVSRADEFMSTTTWYYLLPIFSSITSADVYGDLNNELLFGCKNYVVCLDSSGSEIWKNGESGKQFISTPVVTEVHGFKDYTKLDLDVVVIKDESYTTLNPEIYSNDGQTKTTLSSPGSTELGFMSLGAFDLDGSDSPDIYKDIIFGNRYSPLRLYLNDGNSFSREISTTTNVPCVVYGTGAVGDFVDDERLEFFIGTYEGSTTALANPVNSWGYYYLYQPINGSASEEVDYRLYRKYLPTGASGILSSPAVGDVHCGKHDPKTGEITYEGFLTSYNGRVYCIDISSGDILWSFNSGDHFTSSPAICNIDSDDELEVIVGSNNGIIYCLDGDPSDGIDNGESDSGGTNYDILWQYDTGGNGFWVSSPVVADIDHDKDLEVIIGDKDGVIWCLNAGNITIPGQSDWTTFQHDSKNSGVYPLREKSFHVNLELLNGMGTNKSICYAEYKPYSIQAEVTDYRGFDDLKEVILTIDPERYNVKVKWDSFSDTFSEVYDPNNLIELYSTNLNSSNDGKYTWEIDFNLKFGWGFDSDSPISCSLETIGYSNPSFDRFFRGLLEIENDIEFNGDLEVVSEYQGLLSDGGWLRANEEMAWTNVYVVYENTQNVHPDVEEYNITVSDNNGPISKHKLSEPDDIVYIGMFTPNTTRSNIQYYINISDLPSHAIGINGKIGYKLSIDGSVPEPPQSVILHADSYTDAQIAMDNDTEVFATWTNSKIEYSGIKGYYYNTTDQGGTDKGTFITDTKTILDSSKVGKLDFYIWAVDKVGNIGPANKASILIDIVGVTFSTPSYKNWFNDSKIQLEITIYDHNGSGIDPNSIEYSILPQTSETFGPWLAINQLTDITWLDDDKTNAKVTSWVLFDVEGYNYVRWRAKDQAQNSFSFSDYIRIQIDSKSPKFQAPDQIATTKDDQRIVKANITLIDKGSSGINLSSVQYRYTTTGIDNYGTWKSLELTSVSDESDINLEIDLTLTYGSNNFIEWRAKDQAGNGYIMSGDIQMKINTPPVVRTSSPKDMSVISNYYEDLIEFDARKSFDADGDILHFFWKTKYTTNVGQEKEQAVGTGDYFLYKLQPGYNNITLYVDDGLANITKNIDVFVYDKTTDLDEDGIPNWWEERIFGLDPNDGSDAVGDLDEDSYNNLEEYQRGTSIIDPNDHPGSSDEDKTEDTNFDYILINLILLIIVIVILVSLFLFKRSKIKRSKELTQRQPAQMIMVKRESLDNGFPGANQQVGTISTIDKNQSLVDSKSQPKQTSNQQQIPGESVSTQLPEYQRTSLNQDINNVNSQPPETYVNQQDQEGDL